MPEEQDVHVVDDIQEEKIYDDLCSLRSKAGSQVPHSPGICAFVYSYVLLLKMGIFYKSGKKHSEYQ